jgi:mono/diheme cytochrome c family protein
MGDLGRENSARSNIGFWMEALTEIFHLRAVRGAIACAMPRRLPRLAFAGLFLILARNASSIASTASKAQAGETADNSKLPLHPARTSPRDLEVTGDLLGLPQGSARYIPREDLLKLPQVKYAGATDGNLTVPAVVSGVALEELARRLNANTESSLMIAISSDRYHAYYSHSYITSHHPILVLTINGKSPEDWPKDAEGLGLSLGPYLIYQNRFTASFKVLSQAEVPQIPWAVVRLDFRNEREVLQAIAPRGPRANDDSVQAGYRIAQQNCFRCHNMGREGGTKAGRPWLVLAAWATAAPEYFSAYVRGPKSKNANAEMPGNPNYDDATIDALISYFRTFLAREKP